MVITTPRSAGARRGALDDGADPGADRSRDLALHATHAAYRFMSPWGSRPAAVWQHQGVVTAAPAPDPRVRTLRPEDHARSMCSTPAPMGPSGAMRWRCSWSSPPARYRGGRRITVYALCRRFGRGHVVGPVVAARPEDAVALAAPHVAAHLGRFLRVDTARTDGPFVADAEGLRLPAHDTVTSMWLGRPRPVDPRCRYSGWRTRRSLEIRDLAQLPLASGRGDRRPGPSAGTAPVTMSAIISPAPPDAEAVPAEARGQHQARHGGLADGGDAVRVLSM